MDKYKYNYERTANYCYKDTDVLINNLNITNDKDLYDAERELVMLRTSEFTDNPIKANFDFNHLKAIHKYLFHDIYRWAGEIRNCNIAKQDLFCLSNFIENYATEIFNQLKNEKYFIQYDNKTTLKKLVTLFADINALHPFREGNGRTQREFIKSLARINGIEIDLADVDKENMIIASHDSINGNYEKLMSMFKNNSSILSKEKQYKYIEMYCSEELKNAIQNFMQ